MGKTPAVIDLGQLFLMCVWGGGGGGKGENCL